MNAHPYLNLVSYKRWADRGLYDVAGAALQSLDAQDTALLMRVLDHIHAVDVIFRHHLLGLPHAFRSARSERMPVFAELARGAKEIGDWYVDYVSSLSEADFAQPLDFAFTSGKAARMRRGEMILHVCMHGTYHRGNAGVLLQKNGVAPNDDRMTDFLETCTTAA